jgi:hypothetical protein
MKKGHNFLWPLKELFEILTVAFNQHPKIFWLQIHL